MERVDVLAVIRSNLAEILEVDEAGITEESTLIGDLDADSLDLLELILVLKDEFGITVSDGEVKVLLSELAQFVPDQAWEGKALTDEDYTEIAQSVTVGAMIDFVQSRSAGSTK